MTTWRWYVARGDELMVDLDRVDLIPLALRRLDAAADSGALPVAGAWLYPSGTDGHAHLIVRLQSASFLPVFRRTWEARLCDDRYRNQMNLMRDCFGMVSSLLIAPARYEFRKADYRCECEGKHSLPSVWVQCPVMGALGQHRNANLLGSFSEGGKATTIPKWGKIR